MVISLIFLLTGGISIGLLPVALYPPITPSVINVTASYPGASAQTVMETCIQPIETKLNGVKRMLYMASTASDDGSMQLKVTFDIGTDGDQNTVNTQNRVNWASALLPEEVQRRGVITKEASSNILGIVSLYSPNNTYSNLELSNFLSIYIQDELARIPGMGDVKALGEMTYAIRIWLDPMKMNALKVTVEDISSALRAQNVQVSAGALGDAPANAKQKIRFSVATRGRLSSAEEFEKIVIRKNKDSSPLYLKDVAEVELGAERYTGLNSLNGKSAAMLILYQLNDANALAIIKEVKKRLDRIKGEFFPKDMDYEISYDSTTFISASIEEVAVTLLEAVLLVVLVTFLFLQSFRATLVPLAAIPVSLVGTFAVMAMIGYSINLITLFGLILAIGIVVDDAIVVIENVSRLMEEEGLSPREAALKSMEQVTGPVVATTSVLLAMFVPVCFLPGITGVMYRQFGVTISVSVLISMINALTLSPALCALILKAPKAGETGKKFLFFRWFDNTFDGMTKGYMVIVKSLLRKGALVLFLYGILFLGALHLYKKLPSGFVPDEDQSAFFVSLQLPEGATLQRTHEALLKAQKLLMGYKEVKNVVATSGMNILTSTNSSNTGFAIAVLKDWKERTEEKSKQNALLRRFMREVQRAVPEATVAGFGIPTIPGIGVVSGFSLVLQDHSNSMTPMELQKNVEDVIAEAGRSPVIATAFTTFRASSPQIYLEIDREKAIRLGVDISQVSSALQGFFSYAYINDFNKYGKSYKVELQAGKEFRDGVEDFAHARVRSSTGEMVPLGTFTRPKTNFVPQYLQRYNMYQSVTVNGIPAPGHSSGEAMEEMEKIVKKVAPGLSVEWTDMSYQEKLAGNQILIVFALALLFIFLFLVAQYESWTIPLAVLLSVPAAFLGAVLSLKFLGMDNNIYTQVGLVLLFGIACKTAILIVEFAREEYLKGLSIYEAAEKAATLRFRAVLMTAISFLLGTWPLVAAAGACAVSRRSLGTAVFGGMLFSVIVGTCLIPVFFAVVQKWTAGKKQ